MIRILIIYATAGTGHKKAALAVKEAFNEIGPDVSVEILDSLDYTTTFFKWSYPRFYIFLVNRVPLFWGWCYHILDNKIFYSLTSWIRHLTNWINSRRLAEYLKKENYDVIISTHFLAPDVISMEGRERIKSRLINVITDYRTHSLWIAKSADIYVVAHEKTKVDLISRYGIEEEKIKVLGIPIEPVFSKKKDKNELIKKHGIDKDLFTVLVGSGGFGVGPIIDLVKSFKGVSLAMQLLVVCGKNESLSIEVKGLQRDIRIPMKVYGYIDFMDELMELADVIVTKTGGMMSSESLSKDLPIIGIAPIPGQETRNYNILVESGVVLGVKDINEVPRIVERLCRDKALTKDLKIKIASIKRPDAAYNVARLALKVAGI
ncbi:MAG: hypothetical protein ISS34_02800 [Candidatus Omnitrophica bacterium]|nr:hypothetical protein [Candidatus Omnitrophota bacterium]